MRILFVCTGNICRSPMGELLMGRYLEGTSIEVSSAGTRGLPGHPIDPSSGRLMIGAGIDPSAFRSRRLTRSIAESSDLILCFEHVQRSQIVGLLPSAVRRTFLINEFAQMSKYCAENDMLRGLTVSRRLQSVVAAAPMIRAVLPDAQDIEDPYGKSFDHFVAVAQRTNRAVRASLESMYIDA